MCASHRGAKDVKLTDASDFINTGGLSVVTGDHWITTEKGSGEIGLIVTIIDIWHCADDIFKLFPGIV